MSKRGRPRSQRTAEAYVVRLNLRLYLGEDDDLIAYFQSTPTGLRTARAKAALREGMVEQAQPRGNCDEILDALDAFVE